MAKVSPCCHAPISKDSWGDTICSKCFINIMEYPGVSFPDDGANET